MVKACAIFVLIASYAAGQVVQGNIVNAASGMGIARVAVHLEAASESDDQAYDAVTDALGRFAFAQVKPGIYQFSYYSSAYIRSDTSPFPQVRVVAGAEALELEGRMTALPVISGRVVDARGNAVPGAQVSINGPSVKGTATTDSSGKFEQHLAQSGLYSLAVTAPVNMKPPDREPGSDQPRVWTRVYYPGVTQPEAATKIRVHPGEQISGIELKLRAVPAHIARGVLLNPDGTAAAEVKVGLDIDEPPKDRDQPKTPAYQATTNSEGAFEFPAIADGDWRIAAEVERGGVNLRALQWIEITGHDIDNVKLRLAAPFSVQGRVVMEAREGAAAPQPPSVSLIAHAGPVASESGAASWMLQPETMARTGFRRLLIDQDGAISADADAGGNFNFKDVYAGRYRIAPLAAPTGYYLDSVRLGERDVASAEVELSPGALPITVEYKAGGGAVRGTVEKCASGAVLLIPTDADMRWFDYLHSVRCDAKDHYEIGAVRPGEYYAVAFAGRDSTPSMDAAVLQQASHVTVKAGETVTADLSAISE